MNENQTELTITRFLNASPSTVWKAWTTPEYFAQWWIPAPIECKVIKLDLNPGGGFETQMRQPGEDWQPHLEGCFLEAVPNERLVFTTSLIEGWQPGTPWFFDASGRRLIAHFCRKTFTNVEKRPLKMKFTPAMSKSINKIRNLSKYVHQTPPLSKTTSPYPGIRFDSIPC